MNKTSALEYLMQHGVKPSVQRLAVMEYLLDHRTHPSAEEIHTALVSKIPTLSKTTVYNTLKLFMELRLVLRHRFQGATKYEACYNNGSHSHQVCTICGKVVEIKVPEINAAINDLRLKRFRKDGYSLYIYGVCSACQARMTRKKSNETRQKQQKDNKK